MVAGLGRRYCIYLSDGSVEHRTRLGDAKVVGDTFKLNGRKWRVVRSVKLIGEETDYELEVRPVES